MNEDLDVVALVKVICLVWVTKVNEAFTMNFYICNEVNHYLAENICQSAWRKKFLWKLTHSYNNKRKK